MLLNFSIKWNAQNVDGMTHDIFVQFCPYFWVKAFPSKNTMKLCHFKSENCHISDIGKRVIWPRPKLKKFSCTASNGSGVLRLHKTAVDFLM